MARRWRGPIHEHPTVVLIEAYLRREPYATAADVSQEIRSPEGFARCWLQWMIDLGIVHAVTDDGLQKYLLSGESRCVC